MLCGTPACKARARCDRVAFLDTELQLVQLVLSLPYCSLVSIPGRGDAGVWLKLLATRCRHAAVRT